MINNIKTIVYHRTLATIYFHIPLFFFLLLYLSFALSKIAIEKKAMNAKVKKKKLTAKTSIQTSQ